MNTMSKANTIMDYVITILYHNGINRKGMVEYMVDNDYYKFSITNIENKYRVQYNFSYREINEIDKDIIVKTILDNYEVVHHNGNVKEE